MFTFQALKLGQRIPIAMQLFDSATNKYVRATISKADGSALSGSPFNVPHEANGLYKLNTQDMPNTPFITVQYKVFDDAGFTTPSADHADGLDVFSLAESLAEQAQISGVVSDEALLAGSLESNTLIGTIEECS
jgi:hypothetical protein